ncbi:hypothetical protein [Petrachloros mirabilis]
MAPPYAELLIEFSSLRHIDHSCLNLLQTWQLQHEAQYGKVIVDWHKLRGVSYQTRQSLRQASWWQKVLEQVEWRT